MSKTAARKTTDINAVRNAKRKFVVNVFDMTWKLLLGMAGPVFLGAYLDRRFDGGDLFTAFGFLVSLVIAGLIIKSTVVRLSPQGDKDV